MKKNKRKQFISLKSLASKLECLEEEVSDLRMKNINPFSSQKIIGWTPPSIKK